MNKLLLLLLLMLPSLAAVAQTDQPWMEYYEQFVDIDEAESERLEDAFEQLSELYESKIDINQATHEDLQRLSFLTEEQIDELYEYIQRYAPLRSVGDLAMIESLDAGRRNLLLQFIRFGDVADQTTFPTLQNIAKYGKHELTATAQLPLYDREGDKNGYLGYKYKHWLRYSFKLGDFVRAGLVGSQDSGEPFFTGRNRWGYDYYSFYLLVRKLGRIKTLAVGRYKLRFGMGLILNNNFSFGKMASLQAPNANNTIRAHSSRSESTYLQGAAAQISVAKDLDLTAFASCRKIDATLSDDSSSIRTLLTTGYHRTPSELNRKHNATQTLLGSNLNYRFGGFHVGATAFYTVFSKPLAPNKQQAYRQFYPTGKDFLNASIDYGYSHHRFSVSGETATGSSGGLATLNRLTFEATRSLTLIAIQRFYAYRFNSLFSESFSEGGKVQNESGIYVGATWTPSPYFSATAYTDYAYFPWPRYQTSEASHATDNFVSATVKLGLFKWSTRYRLRIRQQDNADRTALTNKTEHRTRTALAYESDRLKASLQADAAYTKKSEGSFGWMLSPNVSYKFSNASHKFPKLSLSALASYFHTDDYESRVFTYEQGPLYSFTFPMLYGHGIRYGILAKATVAEQLSLTAKVATTDYFDRRTIATGKQLIEASSMTDVSLQLRWKF